MSKLKKISVYVLSLLFLVAGFNHFVNPDFYLKMMPPYLPAHSVLNAVSGAAEMFLAMMLLRPEVRSLAAWGLILLLIAVFPANIHMYREGGAAFGVPDWTLLVRLPLQLVLIAWVYIHTKNPDVDQQGLQTEIDIKASPEKVWQELTRFEYYPEWNPFIVSARGAGRLGDRMEIVIHPPDGSEFRFKNEIIERIENSSLVWKGSFIIRGLFDGTHFFRLEKTSEGTRLTHGEVFEGVLVGMLARLLGSTKRGFQLMNEALKARCES